MTANIQSGNSGLRVANHVEKHLNQEYAKFWSSPLMVAVNATIQMKLTDATSTHAPVCKCQRVVPNKLKQFCYIKKITLWQNTSKFNISINITEKRLIITCS